MSVLPIVWPKCTLTDSHITLPLDAASVINTDVWRCWN